jgi:hypothetical protein
MLLLLPTADSVLRGVGIRNEEVDDDDDVVVAVTDGVTVVVVVAAVDTVEDATSGEFRPALQMLNSLSSKVCNSGGTLLLESLLLL